LTLGIQTLGDVFTAMIPRNTTIPTRKSEIYSTAADGQSAVDVVVYQGERPLASHNKMLGRFQLTDIPPAPRGVPQIEVTFDIDANGIVNVNAKDKGTNREQRITISGTGTLNKDEVERMVRDAEAHAAEDAKVKERAEARNSADQLIYQTDRTLKDLGDSASAEDRQAAVTAQEALRTAVAGDDIDLIKSETEKLQTAVFKLSEALYQKQAAASNGAAPGTNGTGPAPEEEAHEKPADDVIDAEFKAE
jgi:molecular chaperone DnaK